MLDISKLKNRKTVSKLYDYKGSNEYLISLKERLEKEGPFNVSPSIAEYIEKNLDNEPITVNKVVKITEFFGQTLKEKFDLNHIPERIFVEQVLADMDKTYHVKGKVFKNQKYSPLFYIPKTQIDENLTDVQEEVEVDFDKYQKMDKRGWKAFPHQEQGIKFLLSKKRCILADDMGLGKTFQSIVAALETGAEKVLVVCPANAKINWYREIANFVPEEDISILKTGFWNPKRFTIINYDILKNFHTLVDGRKKYDEKDVHRHLVNENFDLIILDEAHMVKNPKADRTKIINQIMMNS